MTQPVRTHPDPAAERSASPRWGWCDALLAMLVLAIAAWVRISHIEPGLSFDELWHLASTTGIGDAMSHYKHDVVYQHAVSLTDLEHTKGLWSIWSGMDGILHPPLFIVALRAWRELFGSTDGVAHGFSVFCGLVAVGFTFASARLAMNGIAAFFAALALALAQTQVYFSQEVRAYAMMIAIGSASLWLMTRIETLGPTRRRLLWLAALTLPLMLTHYFAVGGCLAIAIYGVIKAGTNRRTFIAGIVGAAAAYAVLWLPFAIQQLDDLATGDSFLKVDSGVLHVVLLAAGTPFRLIVERDYQIELTPLLSAVLFVLPWFLFRRLRPLLPWGIWLCASVLPILVLDLARTTVHSAFIRYLAVATPAVTLLFLGSVWAIGWRGLAYGFGAALSFVGAIYLYSGARVLLDADDLTEIRRVIEPRFKPGDAVITNSGALPAFYCDAMTLTLAHSSIIFPTTLAVITRPMSPDLVEALGTRSVWLVSGDLAVPVEEMIPGARVDFSHAATPFVQVRHLVIEPDGGSGVRVPSQAMVEAPPVGAGPATVPSSGSSRAGDAAPSR